MIGQGSQGTVYKGESKSHGVVAIKKIPIPRTQREKECLQNEVDILATFPSHAPMSIRLFDTYKEQSCKCIITEYVDGEQLSVRKTKENDVAHTIRSILRFVALCHSNNIAHRDIKPANFIVSKDGRIRGIDFGVSAFTEDGMCSGGVGTPLYMSPECISSSVTGTLVNGFQSDVWSIAVICFELLTGRHPYDATNIKSSNDIHKLLPRMNHSNIDWDLIKNEKARCLIKRMMSINPSDRPTVFEALQDSWLSEDDTYRNASFFLYLDVMKYELDE